MKDLKTPFQNTEIAPGVIYSPTKVLVFYTQISGEKVALCYDLGRNDYTRNECIDEEPGLLCRVAEYEQTNGEFKYAFSLAGLKNISSYYEGEKAVLPEGGICWFVLVMNAWAACPKFCETIKKIADLEKEKNSNVKIAQCMDEIFKITKTPFTKNQEKEYLNRCQSAYIEFAKNLWTFSMLQEELLGHQIKKLEEGKYEKEMLENLKIKEKIYHATRILSEKLITCRGSNATRPVFSIINALKNHHYNLVGDKSPEEVWGNVTLIATNVCYPGYMFFEAFDKTYKDKVMISNSISTISKMLEPSSGSSTENQTLQDAVKIQCSIAPQILHIIQESKNIPSKDQRWYFGRQYTFRSVILASKIHARTKIKAQNGNWFDVDGSFVFPENSNPEWKDTFIDMTENRTTHQILVYERD